MGIPKMLNNEISICTELELKLNILRNCFSTPIVEYWGKESKQEEYTNTV